MDLHLLSWLNSLSVCSAFARTRSRAALRLRHRSIRPLIMTKDWNKQVKSVRQRQSRMDGRKPTGKHYLCDNKETHLPLRLRWVITQILVILERDYRRKLLQGEFVWRRRGEGFSWLVDGAFIKPLPDPCFIGVTVFVPLAINPTTGSRETFYCFWGRSDLDGGFLFIDGAVPLGTTSPDSFLLATCAFIRALLLASSIFAKKDG